MTVTNLAISEFDVSLIPNGSKSRTRIVVGQLPDGKPLAFPVLVVRGARAGKTLLATGAIHGDEFEGAVAIQDVFAKLDPFRMRGSFIGIPVVNGPAFLAGFRTGSHDNQDLARVFPGSIDGSPTEQLAHAIGRHFIPIADLYIDLHSAGNAYRIKPFAGYQLRSEFVKVQREAAVAFGLDLVWGTVGLPGRSLSSAWEKGVPAIYVELEGEGRCRTHSRSLAVQGLCNLLAYLGIVEGNYSHKPPDFSIEDGSNGSGHLQLENISPVSGLFVPEVDVWDPVTVGKLIGVVRFDDGRVGGKVKSAKTGRVLLIRTFPRVVAGDSVAYVIDVHNN